MGGATLSSDIVCISIGVAYGAGSEVAVRASWLAMLQGSGGERRRTWEYAAVVHSRRDRILEGLPSIGWDGRHQSDPGWVLGRMRHVAVVKRDQYTSSAISFPCVWVSCSLEIHSRLQEGVTKAPAVQEASFARRIGGS